MVGGDGMLWLPLEFSKLQSEGDIRVIYWSSAWEVGLTFGGQYRTTPDQKGTATFEKQFPLSEHA